MFIFVTSPIKKIIGLTIVLLVQCGYLVAIYGGRLISNWNGRLAQWDPALNKVRGEEAFVTYSHSPVKVIIIPTNEEVMIARDVIRLAHIKSRDNQLINCLVPC